MSLFEKDVSFDEFIDLMQQQGLRVCSGGGYCPVHFEARTPAGKLMFFWGGKESWIFEVYESEEAFDQDHDPERKTFSESECTSYRDAVGLVRKELLDYEAASQ